jgi:phenylalanyl-tRNA synthetase beta chain
MKISLAWLQTQFAQTLEANALQQDLTLAGLEVSSQTPVANTLANIVVGLVTACEPHPNADRLTVCQVDVASEVLTIVCGAKNVKPGLRVAVAKIGGCVGDLKIRKSKLRGVESFGMLCSASELGLVEPSTGIIALADDAPLGSDLSDYLLLNDISIDIDLTPNRGDCLSIEGIAREVAAINALPYQAVQVDAVATSSQQIFPVRIAAKQGCGQYIGRVISGIDINCASPMWLKERLRRCGLRSIDAVVDVTNYVMLELGQPMHAFDLDTLSTQITVRAALAGESLTLLDGQTLSLDPDCLVIADEQRCLALAGVMGGEHSGVSTTTTNIVLESAYFDPLTIAGKARRFGLHTESSHRFERGVDPGLQRRAMERATQLLLTIVGGSVGPLNEVVVPQQMPHEQHILLRSERIARVLGVVIEAATVQDYLTRLGFLVTAQGQNFDVTVPSYRFDVNMEIDLIEEIARLIGYQELPTQYPTAQLKLLKKSEARVGVQAWRQLLVADGYREVINYSFVDASLQQQLMPQHQALSLSNPLSPELSAMRVSLWVGLLETLKYNQHRQVKRMKIFETGLCFRVQDELLQQPMLAGALCGGALPEQWAAASVPVDFFDLKKTVERIVSLTKRVSGFEFKVAEHPALHPGQSASLCCGEQVLGYCGRLHPTLERRFGLTGPVYLFELELASLAQGHLPGFKPYSKYPYIRRDLALLVSAEVSAQAILQSVKDYAGQHLVDVQLFDVYQGKGVEPGQKSIALGVTLQDIAQTLTEAEVSATINTIISGLESSLGATLRN